MTFRDKLFQHLIEGAASDHAGKPKPSRNKYGVTSLDVCRLDAKDIVEATFTNVPNGSVIGPLMGSMVLYMKHPLQDSYIVVRDQNGAPGPTITSVAFIQCGCGMPHGDEEE